MVSWIYDNAKRDQRAIDVSMGVSQRIDFIPVLHEELAAIKESSPVYLTQTPVYSGISGKLNEIKFEKRLIVLDIPVNPKKLTLATAKITRYL